MDNRFVIDRFEGNYAVLEPMEGEGTLDIPRALLGFEAHEGDVIILRAEHDPDATQERSELIRRKMDELWD